MDLRKVYDLFPALELLSGRWGGTLSGGEQQMCAIGRALMANPRLILLDELSLGLAPVIIRRIYETIDAIAREGTTVVLVEQDVGQALAAADRAYCLLEGRVSLHGPTGELTRERVVEAYFGVAVDGLGQRGRPGHPPRRAVRALRHRPLARLRRHAAREPRTRRPDRARRVPVRDAGGQLSAGARSPRSCCSSR